jgi:hypothetical protein
MLAGIHQVKGEGKWSGTETTPHVKAFVVKHAATQTQP